MELYVVRHGETDLNVQGAIRGWIDAPLNDKGRAQAERLGQALKDLPFTQAWTSDLQRAADTAFAIIGAHPTPPPMVTWTELLRPINFGDLQGRPPEEVGGNIRGLFEAWKIDPHLPAPGGESFADFQARAHTFMQRLLTAQAPAGAPEECILIVTHVRVCSWMTAYILNECKPLEGPQVGMLDGSEVSPGNYLTAGLNDRGRLVIRRINLLEDEYQP